jgi:hypothetical protein
MGIYSKLKESFEATKVSVEGWVAFAVCVALTAIFLLIALLIWLADLIGPVWACLLLAAVFAIGAISAKLLINAKEAEAKRKLTSAKAVVKRDVELVTQPLRSAEQAIPRQVRPALPVVFIALAILLAYFSRNEHESQQLT